MVHLSLTVQEVDTLQHLLRGTPDSQAHQPLLAKLAAARATATARRLCPVCQRWFTQEQLGRTGRYCTNACKQKAYRQRRRTRQHAARRRPLR